jgi:hypothetical protein
LGPVVVAKVCSRFGANFLKRSRKLRDEALRATARNCGCKGTEYLGGLTKLQAKDPTFAGVGILAAPKKRVSKSSTES